MRLQGWCIAGGISEAAMVYLVIVSLIWSFSFGLISTFLGGIDPYVVATLRITIALLVFLPFLRLKKTSGKFVWRFMLIGGIQYGLMYATYMYSYQFMAAHKVALFTVTTPVFVSLLDDLFEKRFRKRYLAVALVAVVGALIINWKTIDYGQTTVGILLLQASNICFAIGQVFYRRILRKNTELQSKNHFAWLYLGGFIVTALLMLMYSDLSTVSINAEQWIVIALLGVISSGLGFFLWNYGAIETSAGTLAVMNNLKVPLAVIVTLVVFEGSADLFRLLIGGGIIIGSVLWSERLGKRST